MKKEALLASVAGAAIGLLLLLAIFGVIALLAWLLM